MFSKDAEVSGEGAVVWLVCGYVCLFGSCFCCVLGVDFVVERVNG